ncbi:MAG: hypothetical protein ABJ308_08130 [Halieaceae bacterium]
MLAATPLQARERGDLPTPFGQGFYLASESLPQPLPPLLSAPEAEQWLDLIQQSEWQLGPYGADLSETLLDAANYFHSRGDYRSAIVHWRRAVHLTRVNDGLYSDLQLPVLRQLLQTYLAMQDYESAHEIQAYLYHLHKQQYQLGETAHIKATLEYADWLRRRWMREPDKENLKPLYDIWRLVDKEVEDSEEAPLTVAQLEPLTYAQLDMLYLIGVSDLGMDREAEMLFGRQYGQSQGEISVERSQLQYLQQSAYARGKSRLELLDERLGEDGDPILRAELQRNLGDWHMWNEYTQRALDSYQRSWELLAADATGSLRQQWYQAPLELPAGGVLFPGVLAEEEFSKSALVDASFSVTARGQAKNVESHARDPEREGMAYRVTRWLRNGRFRPRLEDGVAVATDGVTREYRVN